MRVKPVSVEVGSVWDSKSFGKFEILEVNSSISVKIRFLSTGFTAISECSRIRNGSVRDKLKPNVYGVGFIGDGDFRSGNPKKLTEAYDRWKSMLRRCYGENENEKFKNYNDCKVCDEWHNFQNFARWFYGNNLNDYSGIQIDKDLIGLENKIYSPENCILVSVKVNSFIIDSSASRGKYMIGTTMHGSGKFMSQCSNPISGKSEYLGLFNTEIDAHMAWRSRKSQLALELSAIQDRDEVKMALILWKSRLDDNSIHKY